VTPAPATANEAIRLAAKLAIDEGDFARAKALLDVVDVDEHPSAGSQVRALRSG
jgi:hypothetical protein